MQFTKMQPDRDKVKPTGQKVTIQKHQHGKAQQPAVQKKHKNYKLYNDGITFRNVREGSEAFAWG